MEIEEEEEVDTEGGDRTEAMGEDQTRTGVVLEGGEERGFRHTQWPGDPRALKCK